MSSRLSLVANCRLLAGALLTCCIVILSAGCGPDYKSRGVVKGKVTIGKKALTTGTVMFVNPEGISASASIDTDGNYEMKDAPVGECKVTVTVSGLPGDPSVRARMQGKGIAMPAGPRDPNKPPEEAPQAPGAKMPKEIVQIPSKYADASTSELKFTVKKGEQTWNIEL